VTATDARLARHEASPRKPTTRIASGSSPAALIFLRKHEHFELTGLILYLSGCDVSSAS
jgi:hypothetical protein